MQKCNHVFLRSAFRCHLFDYSVVIFDVIWHHDRIWRTVRDQLSFKPLHEVFGVHFIVLITSTFLVLEVHGLPGVSTRYSSVDDLPAFFSRWYYPCYHSLLSNITECGGHSAKSRLLYGTYTRCIYSFAIDTRLPLGRYVPHYSNSSHHA